MAELVAPVGNTSEASASLGGSGRLYSPFSPYYNPAKARKIGLAETQRILRRNPPLSGAERDQILAYQSDAANKVVIPTHAALAVAGCMVNREWSSAADLCDQLAAFARSKSTKPQAGGVTFVQVYDKLAQYLRAIAAGQEPLRTPANKGELKKYGSRPIPLWDDVAKCALAEDGNVKLPFAAYSEFPVVTCPGAGGVAARYGQLAGAALGAANVSEGVDIRGCASFCYSLKALRNPTVCYRLYIQTLGMSVDPERHVSTVGERMLKLNAKKGVKILRLFVDGDFRSAAAIESWMGLVKRLGAAGITVYGYSKSWPEFHSLQAKYGSAWWPTNYVLNLSSGSRYFKDPAWLVRMKEIPVARGEFIAVDPLERLVWKAFTKARGMVAWSRYVARINAIANGNARDSAKTRLIERLRANLGAAIAHANPELAAAYNDYVQTIHDLEAPNSTLLSTVRSAIGQPEMIPGPIVQASTFAFLSGIKQPDEMPCPISCGSCPGTAIPQHEKVIKAAHMNDTALLQEMNIVEKTKQLNIQRAKIGGNVHLCGNAKAKKSIIIGVH
jgi:hypothetical protein